MCKYYAVIFDCDGVMFDSRQANINFYNNILKRLGLSDMTKEEEAYIHMHTVGESLHYILKDTPFEKMADNYSIGNDYFPFLKNMVMEPGLKELLSALKPDFRLGIATNRTTTIGEVLKINGIDTFFDIVVSSLDVKKIKPHPESLYKILDFLKIDPEQAKNAVFYHGKGCKSCGKFGDRDGRKLLQQCRTAGRGNIVRAGQRRQFVDLAVKQLSGRAPHPVAALIGEACQLLTAPPHPFHAGCFHHDNGRHNIRRRIILAEYTFHAVGARLADGEDLLAEA